MILFAVLLSICLRGPTDRTAVSDSVEAEILAPGDLDLTFGSGGKAITDVNVRPNGGGGAVIQADGKVVAVGSINNVSTSNDALLVRYNIDGSLDNTFGTGGFVIADHNGQFNTANAIAIQPDGKLIAFGQISRSLIAMRFNTDGMLDTTFGMEGKVLFSLGNFAQPGNAVLVQPDGKVVGVAEARDSSNLPAMGVVRFNANGTVDNTFGDGGKVIISFGGTDAEFPTSVNLQTDGKLVIAGVTDRPVTFRDFAVARLNIDGSMDNTFGVGGKVVTDVDRLDGVANSVIQRDGKILVMGFSFTGSKLAVVRYNSDGSLDGSFGNAGRVQTVVSPGENFGSAVAVQPDGKILAAASTGVFPDRTFGLVRYDSNGFVDTSFGTNGVVVTQISPGNVDNPKSVLLQNDGKIIVSGETGTAGPTETDFAVVRYLNDLPVPTPTPIATPTPTPIPTSGRTAFDYDGDGKADISIYRPSVGDWYVQRSRDGLFGVRFGRETDKITPADFDGDGKTDVAVYRPSDGTWYIVRSLDSTFQFAVFGLADDIPVPGDFDGDSKADVSVFRPSSGTWFRLNSSTGAFFGRQFGATGDTPVMGDFDGDAKADLAVFRPSNGVWYYIRSSDGSFYGEQFGAGGDTVVPADYDGDGKTDLAVYRPSNGFWYLKRSLTSDFAPFQFGQAGDVPAPGDFDGDGKADISVFRPSDGQWYRTNSGNGSFFAFPFGISGDRPTQSAFQ